MSMGGVDVGGGARTVGQVRGNVNASQPKGGDIRRCLDDSLVNIYRTIN